MELIKDVGIAFVVAAIVGGVFEVGVRNRFQEAISSGTVHAILGNWIGPDIWQDVQRQIFGRKALRKNLDIKFKLDKDPKRDLPENGMVFWLRVEYDLYLKEQGRKENIEVAHYLLSHISYGDLPRFVKAIVGGKSVPIDNIVDGELKLNIDVEGRDGNPVRVVVEREEFVYVPGMYTLVTYEMTKGLNSLLPMELPNDIDASLNLLPPISFALRQETSLEENETFCPPELKDLLFLPGQAIEIWFRENKERK